MLGVRIAPQTPVWVWYHTVSERFEAVYGCVYSISRLSARAIDRLLAKRREASVGASDEIRDEWPNDESFTASTVMAEGLVACDFNDRGRAFYSGRSFRNGAAFDSNKLTAAEPDGLIYHPVQTLDVWLEGNRKKLGEVKEAKFRHQLSAMKRYAVALMESEELRDFALIPLIQARTGWRNPSWRNYRHAADESNKAEEIERMLANAFGIKQDKQQVAVVYNTWSKVRPNSTRLASPREFEFTDGVPVRTFPKSLALPFCWDLDAQEMLFTLLLKPQVVLDRPFLYEGQRDLARMIACVPLQKLNRIFGEYDPDAPLTFLMSIGRTGSTLFHSLLKVAVPRSISEPDTLTQVAAAPPGRDQRFARST